MRGHDRNGITTPPCGGRGTFFIVTVILGLMLFGVTPRLATAAGYRLSLSTGDRVQWFRADSIIGSLAGMRSELIVRIVPVDREVAPSDYAGVLAWEWPSNLHVEICRRSPGDTVFVPDSDLRDQLGLHYHVGPGEARNDSIWRQTGQTPPWYDLAPIFRFPFRLPESLVGQEICFRVTYESDRFGTLASEETKCLTVKRPVSRWDTSLVRDDLVRYAEDLGDWPTVMHIADSLISLGWSSIYGLNIASGAARRLGQYDRAIRYLDLCFQRHGSVFMKEGRGATDPAAERRVYEAQRTRLMELKNQQQQR